MVSLTPGNPNKRKSKGRKSILNDDLGTELNKTGATPKSAKKQKLANTPKTGNDSFASTGRQSQGGTPNMNISAKKNRKSKLFNQADEASPEKNQKLNGTDQIGSPAVKNINTPKKIGTPANKQNTNTPKKGQTPAKHELNKTANAIDTTETDSPKEQKLQKFPGTSALGSKPDKSTVKKGVSPGKIESVGDNVFNRSHKKRLLDKKRRQDVRKKARQLMRDAKMGGAATPEFLKQIADRLEQINKRPTLTKTARRMKRQYETLLGVASGKVPGTQANTSNVKQNSKGANTKQKPVKKQSKPQKEKKVEVVIEEQEENSEDASEDSEDSDYDTEKIVTVNKVTKKLNESVDDEELGGVDSDDDDEDSDEVEAEEEESADAEEGSDEEEEDSADGDDQESGEEDADSDSGDDDDEIEIQINKKSEKQKPQKQQKAAGTAKGQSRYILFVGNLPYDASKEEIIEHFKKIGEVVDVRIPADKQSQKPRGFAYLEVKNEVSYEKGLSMHHTMLKGRRINVLYTQGGKKKSGDQKKQIKSKNFKLQEMRKQGKLAGSVKETQKRSARRGKQRNSQGKSDE